MDLKWKPQIDMWLPSEDNFIPTALPFLSCFEGVKNLGLSDLQIRLWKWRRTHVRERQWKRMAAFERMVTVRLLGLHEEGYTQGG